MRHVRKRQEPNELTTYRAQPGSRYDGDSGFPPVKQAIREALVREHNGLCCYCNQRVRPTDGGMRIEHRVPQSVDATRDLDWRNLLAACPGNEGGDPTHCDVARGNAEMALDPTQEAHVATMTFAPDGRLCSARPDLQREISDVLRLNCDMLIDRRQRALDAYIRERFAGRVGGITRETLERWLAEIDEVPEGRPLPPFVSFLRSAARAQGSAARRVGLTLGRRRSSAISRSFGAGALRVGLPERLNTVRRLPQGDGADARVVGARRVDHVDDLLEEPQRDALPPRDVAVTHVSLDGHARGLLKRHDVIEQVEEPVHTNLADSPLSQREPKTSTAGPVSSHGGLRATCARHPRDTRTHPRALAPRSPPCATARSRPRRAARAAR